MSEYLKIELKRNGKTNFSPVLTFNIPWAIISSKPSYCVVVQAKRLQRSSDTANDII